jgi:hypothetical protein
LTIGIGFLTFLDMRLVLAALVPLAASPALAADCPAGQVLGFGRGDGSLITLSQDRTLTLYKDGRRVLFRSYGGPFGTFSPGRQNTPVYMVADPVEPGAHQPVRYHIDNSGPYTVLIFGGDEYAFDCYPEP